jgi:quercetin 2,3-dioxygenase
LSAPKHAKLVQKLHPAARDDIQDLVTRRPLPGPALPHLDPFLFLNHHGPQVYPPRNDGLPFGPHPHRGFATVTFIVAGALSHEDSGGHASIIEAGGVQWMSAGKGLTHAELSPESFRESGGPLEILQLWVNLPARLKMSPPRYEGFSRLEEFTEEGATVRLFAGPWGARQGPLVPPVELTLAELVIPPGGGLRLPVKAGENVLFYVMRGSVNAGGVPVPEYFLAEFGREEGEISVKSAEGARVLYGRAPPYGEPIVAYGPFVMNSEEEIRQAIRDYQSGKFGR